VSSLLSTSVPVSCVALRSSSSVSLTIEAKSAVGSG